MYPSRQGFGRFASDTEFGYQQLVRPLLNFLNRIKSFKAESSN
jgi:hypothetical protein